MKPATVPTPPASRGYETSTKRVVGTTSRRERTTVDKTDVDGKGGGGIRPTRGGGRGSRAGREDWDDRERPKTDDNEEVSLSGKSASTLDDEADTGAAPVGDERDAAADEEEEEEEEEEENDDSGGRDDVGTVYV